MNCLTASGVHGIFAPSPTALHPFFIRDIASSLCNSFSVAHGMAISHLIFHGDFFE